MSDDIIKRLREAIAEHPLSPIHGYAADIADLLDRLDAAERERDSKAAELANLQVAFSDWKVFHSTARLEAENERLRSESKAQLEELDRIDDALGTNEGPSAVDHIVILKTENERLRAALDIARDYVAANVAYLRQRYRGREQFGRVHEAEGDLAAIDAARAAEQSERRGK